MYDIQILKMLIPLHQNIYVYYILNILEC